MKYFVCMQLRYKLYCFATALFAFTFLSSLDILKYKTQTELMASNGRLAAEQTVWLESKDKIYSEFNDACDKLRGGTLLNSTLISFTEKVIPDCGCKYDLANTHKCDAGNISIASVSAKLHNISLEQFIGFSDAISVDGVRMSAVNFTVGSDGNLNAECTIEAISLGDR